MKGEKWKDGLPGDDAGISDFLGRYGAIVGAPPLRKGDIRAWKRDPISFRTIDPVERLLRLAEHSGKNLPLHWLASRLGGMLVKPSYHLDPADLSTWFLAANSTQRLRQAITTAFITDREGKTPASIDREEAFDVTVAWIHCRSFISGFISAAKDGCKPPPPAASLPAKPGGENAFRDIPSWRIIASALPDRGSKPDSLSAGECLANLADRIAEPFGWRADSLYKWAKPRKTVDCPDATGMANPLDYALAISVALDSTAIIRHLAEKRGCSFVPLETLETSVTNARLKGWQEVVLQLCELELAITRALLDGKLDPREIAEIEGEWQDVVAFMASFLSRLE